MRFVLALFLALSVGACASARVTTHHQVSRENISEAHGDTMGQSSGGTHTPRRAGIRYEQKGIRHDNHVAVLDELHSSIRTSVEQGVSGLLSGLGVVPLRGNFQLRGGPMGSRVAASDWQQVSDTTLPLSSGGLVEVNLPFGNVTVVGWSGPGVRVRQADAGNAPLVRGSASLVAISYAPNISGNSSRGRGSSGSIEVSVPASARISLDIGSGNVSLRGVGGDVEVAARTGDVVLENTGGRVTVSAFAGNLRISGASGPVSADIVAGNISVDGAEGDLDLKTVSGILELSGIKSLLVTASSTSGIVTMEGVLAPDGNYALESFVGVVRLRIPQSSSAIFSLETFSGDIRTAIPMTLESGDSGRQPQQRRILRLGSGNAKVSMKTFSGSVLIERSGG